MGFQNPTTSNLADYATFLASVVGLDPKQFVLFQGSATNGSTTQLFDVTHRPFNATLNGYDCIDLTQNVTALIASNDQQQVTFTTPLVNPVLSGDQYLVCPDILPTSFALAQEIVNQALNAASPTVYTLAVYNLAADRLINFAPDLPNQTYFQDMRANLRLSSVSVGVPSAVSDNGTALGILNPEQLKMLTLQDLSTLRTPYGRQYMAFAQMYGQSIWGVN